MVKVSFKRSLIRWQVQQGPENGPSILIIVWQVVHILAFTVTNEPRTSEVFLGRPKPNYLPKFLGRKRGPSCSLLSMILLKQMWIGVLPSLWDFWRLEITSF
jgi:hypothetical protein